MEMITELGLPGLSRGGGCVRVWGDPRGGRVGGPHISAPNTRLVPHHAGAPLPGSGRFVLVLP